MSKKIKNKNKNADLDRWKTDFSNMVFTSETKYANNLHNSNKEHS